MSTYKIFNTANVWHVMFKYFTVAEANEILPEVATKFREAAKIRSDITKIERKLQEAMTATNVSGSYSNKHSNPLKTYMELKQELNSAVSRLYRSIEMLEAMGVALKGLESGMVDFPAKRFNEDIWLCWKFGETEIKFWHDIESGFMGRKPIKVSDESLV